MNNQWKKFYRIEVINVLKICDRKYDTKHYYQLNFSKYNINNYFLDWFLYYQHTCILIVTTNIP